MAVYTNQTVNTIGNRVLTSLEIKVSWQSEIFDELSLILRARAEIAFYEGCKCKQF